jgi:LMBR1 domain-containing protein 1
MIPVDIYVTSSPNDATQVIPVNLSQETVRTAYLACFSLLLVLAFFLVPYAYFYGEERGDSEDKERQAGACEGSGKALRSTAFFVIFILILLLIGLNFQPGHTDTLDKEHGLRWFSDLLDVDHGGLGAISFCIACLTCVGVIGWVSYTAYGIAAMPFDWLRGKQSPKEQRRDLEQSIDSIREKFRGIQSKYANSDDGSPKLSQMKASDRKELAKLKREQKTLSQHNYRLQEMEQQAGVVIPHLLLCLVPFRWFIGVAMLAMSFLVVSSLLITSLDRLLHSPCGWKCGYTMNQHFFYNPADEIFLHLSRLFPLDFVLIGILVLYIFMSSIFGIVGLGIRALCFKVFSLKSGRSSPQALLVLCIVMAHILLALCMALLTIAPNYTAFGSQQVASAEDGSTTWCSWDKRDLQPGCQLSVISKFFSRITSALPFFSVAYYYANWAFIFMFGNVFAHCLFFQKRQAFLEPVAECDEEEVGLLAFP